MRHLVKLSDLAPRQYDEVVALLRKHRVHFKEIPSGMFDVGFIMVADRDFATAQAVLRDEAREFAKEAREAWDHSWHTEHHGSWVNWFFHRLRQHPGSTILKVILLVLTVAILLIYPVWYVVRAAI
jgi:hypothetical protein